MCKRWLSPKEFQKLPYGTAFSMPCRPCVQHAANLQYLVHPDWWTDGTTGTVKVVEVLDMNSFDVLGRTVAEVLDEKRQSGHYPELVESIRMRGVERPIVIRHGELLDGHHRVAACVDLGIEGVNFTDDLKCFAFRA